MPVHLNPGAAVAGVPFGEEILVPGAELLGIAGTRCRGLAPQVRGAHGEDGVAHPANRLTELRRGDVLAPHVEHIIIAVGPAATTDAFEPRIRPQAVQRPE